MEPFEIVRIINDKKKTVTDFITEEIPLTLTIDNEELVTLLASPFDLKELTAGFLFTSGLIKEKGDIKSIRIDTERWTSRVTLNRRLIRQEMMFKRVYSSGCGRGTFFYDINSAVSRVRIGSTINLEAADISELARIFQQKSERYKKTGGVHSAALCTSKDIIISMEDIGRHNAVDKVIGSFLLDNIPYTDKILLTTGRISSEIVLKTVKAGIPCIISRGAPTDQAVKIAKELEVTLIGFVRGARMNIYSGEVLL